MKAVLQRVESCFVTVSDKITGSIKSGLLVYLGIHQDDNKDDINFLSDKIVNLRIFQDENGKMNLSVLDTAKEILVVSQFTLLADTRKGRRPSYNLAALPEKAEYLYEELLHSLRIKGINPQHGIFGAMMDVTYTNKGPVTIILDSRFNN